jgi:large subunit ribosomal protein L1
MAEAKKTAAKTKNVTTLKSTSGTAKSKKTLDSPVDATHDTSDPSGSLPAVVVATPEKSETTADSMSSDEQAIKPQEADTKSESEAATAPVAKAGKRSLKVQREVAEESARKDRAHDSGEDEVKPRQAHKPTRSLLERRGKRFRKSAELIEIDTTYDLAEAITLAQKTSPVSFDASVELHINLNVDPRHADQNIRDNLVLPSGTGKQIVIAVLTDDAATATAAGANIAGNEELLATLDKGTMNFDILISTPMLMAKLGKYARMLGPRGLMPNPKSGTVTNDITKAVSEAKAGRVEYRVDSTGIVHLAVGKVSFTQSQLMDNIQAVITSIKNNKPASVKSGYFKAVHLSTSMGPSITVNIASVS